MDAALATRADTDAERRALRRIGAWCAIAGSVVSVAAGASVGSRMSGLDAAATLAYLAGLPSWVWPLTQLGFVTGALLWVAGFAALARDRAPGTGAALGRLAVLVIVIGASVHVVDASLGGSALGRLAGVWATAPAGGQPALVASATELLRITAGSWASVVSLFHGVPFVLLGLAVMLDSRRPGWVGGIALGAGLGSVVAGVASFLGAAVPVGLAPVCAVTVSLWMVGMGIGLLRDRSA